ncbi:hypothetical protein LTR47_007944 [Exophiala xenobiotica]|nr:hypothetical protein LTR41_005184 [Exophiala xenobiotica]KAK5229342.1 hypothetical protein LTR47_007944 [Exophiala xenobiotica]KAK5352580.1 hypothetical protein LTR61_003706 [Exophiala xenobiotica]KAK5375443.1 hypothetical protein LTR11_004993 [Exophiala xenobiotica]KAK5391308.1 hypothetical protein LTS03_000681 [Exophiala xenobiotica]
MSQPIQKGRCVRCANRVSALLCLSIAWPNKGKLQLDPTRWSEWNSTANKSKGPSGANGINDPHQGTELPKTPAGDPPTPTNILTKPDPMPSYDYIIVGGGVAGLTLAARLSKLLPPSGSGSGSGENQKQILVLEAGTDPSETESILSSLYAHQARESEHSYDLEVTANPHLNNRTVRVPVGKAIGGSAAINGGAWTRGPKSDYDYWAKLVADDAWSYDNLLPYFRMTENVFTGSGEGKMDRDELHHGYEGPLTATPVRANWPKRKYPLRESVQKAWEEAGVRYNADGNKGDQNGLTEMVEVWLQGARQLPGKFYDLSHVEIRDHCPVQRVTFDIESESEQPVANGVDIVGGEHIVANTEVIISAGVYHSPQVLMLSGVGDPAILAKYGIRTVAANVEVGKNLKDHLGLGLTWKLKHPEKGLALGSPLLTDPSYFAGWPMDFIEFGSVNEPSKLERLIEDRADREFLLRDGASHMELAPLYVPLGRRLAGIDAAFDGSHITTLCICLATTSGGSVTIQSAKAQEPPVIDLNSNATESDRYILREALRKASNILLETEPDRSFISHEVTPEGYAPITRDASDEEIDGRIREFAVSIDHPLGSCSMGRVVDSHCRVVGVRGLRVVDASVFPIPLACHIQAAVYALGERVAEWAARGE